MIVNVNPIASDFDETQHVLGYASMAKTIKISEAELNRKRKAITSEATHDDRGRAIGRTSPNSKVLKMARKFSPPRKREGKEPTKKRNDVPSNDSALPPQGKQAKRYQSSTNSLSMKGLQEKVQKQEKEIKKLEEALSKVISEQKFLHSHNAELQEALSEREDEVRQEVAHEMQIQLSETRQRYEHIIEDLKLHVHQSENQSMMSARKIQTDRAQKHVDELRDKVEECEEEMVRMRENHLNEIASLKEEQGKERREFETEMSNLNLQHAAELEKLNAIIEAQRKSTNELRKTAELADVKGAEIQHEELKFQETTERNPLHSMSNKENIKFPNRGTERDPKTGMWSRPRGRAPVGREWDEQHGGWRVSLSG